jgi:proteic killer suppression protein
LREAGYRLKSWKNLRSGEDDTPRRRGRTITLDNLNAPSCYPSLIKSFHCKDTEKLFNRRLQRKFPPVLKKAGLRKLEMLDAAESLRDLKVIPSSRLEALSGNRKGQYSVRINRQWRICFHWETGDAFDVEVVDYH